MTDEPKGDEAPDDDGPSRYGPMMGLLAATGAPHLATILLDTFGVVKLTPEEKAYLQGPIVVHRTEGWVDDMPDHWFNQARAERFEAVLGTKPGWLVGPTELMLVLTDAMHTAPRGHELTSLYLWASVHAIARHHHTSVEEGWQRMGMEPIPDSAVLEPNGKFHREYRDLSAEIRRKVATGGKDKRAKFIRKVLRAPTAVAAHEELVRDGPPPKLVEIPPEVAAALRTADIVGNLLTLPQLDRKLYEATDRVLRKLGGKWNRRRRGHVFPEDPTQLLMQALDSGAVTDRKATLSLFETPPEIARRMAANVRPGDAVLEPSAGRGRLVAAAYEAAARSVDAIDIDAQNVAALAATFPRARVRQADFLKLPPSPDYEAVLMNPPFRNGDDVSHVEHAWSFLRPGGTLTAIVSEASFRGDSDARRRFMAWLSESRATVERLPGGSFRAEGTEQETRIVSARRGSNA